MKKIITIVFVLFSIWTTAQTYQTKSGNWNYTGYSKFSATKLKVGNTALTETKIQNYDSALADSLSPEGILVMIKDSGNVVNGYATGYDFHSEAFQASKYLLAPLKLLGSPVNAMTLTMTHTQARDNNALTDGRIQLIPVYYYETTTVTGVILNLVVQGNYVGDNYNGIGLYSYSGGVLTLRASSTNDSEIWKATGYTNITKAFSTPYSAAPGLYFVAALYNSSSQATAPTLLGSNIGGAGITGFNFTGDRKLSGSLDAQNTLPATITMSATATSSFMYLTWTYE